MIAVDSNIVVRLLTQDDEAQYIEAYRLFQENTIFIADTVILEVEWVLRYAYNFAVKDIVDAFRKLFGMGNVSLVNAGLMADALDWSEQGMDFSDAIHLIQSQNLSQLVTFDKQYIKAAKGLVLHQGNNLGCSWFVSVQG